MKPLLLSLILLLSACSGIPNKYDNNQFLLWVETLAEVERLNQSCQSSEFYAVSLATLRYRVDTLAIYEQYTPNNPEAERIASIIRDDVNQMLARKYSPAYCEMKTSLMVEKIKPLIALLPRKSR